VVKQHVKEQRAPSAKKKQSIPQKKKPPKQQTKEKPEILDLHEIPKPVEEFNDDFQEDTAQEEFRRSDNSEEVLREIKPQPFRGSIIADKGVYGQPPQIKTTSDVDSSSNQSVALSSPNMESTLVKQKQLEEDMTKVLSFLSKKITVKPLKPVKKEDKIKKLPEKAIPPSSMSEILKDLLKLDLHIEASAIIKKDGTILASAISSRISDSLFATIGQNLSMIGSDIVEGLSAGNLLNISIRGTNGVLDLAPIGSKETLGDDMLLIIFSHPKVKSGIIHFAVSIVKKQVSQYLGLSK
jgi:predicted regulator of Ras-like GTPase activity (Roadblock/LC7/MglB family)